MGMGNMDIDDSMDEKIRNMILKHFINLNKIDFFFFFNDLLWYIIRLELNHLRCMTDFYVYCKASVILSYFVINIISFTLKIFTL